MEVPEPLAVAAGERPPRPGPTVCSGTPLTVRELEAYVRRLEEQLRQMQPMQTLGALATGIAHDFNNLLTAILGFSELIRSELGSGHALEPSLDVISTAATHGARLTGQILRLAREGRSERTPFDLQEVVRQVADFLDRTSGPALRVHCQLDLPELRIDGDPALLYQVFLNLGLNARDAMPGGGDLSFTASIELPGSDPQPPERAREFACVSVADCGSGIPAEIRARIFEPFFTTKRNGRSLGMGLALVDRIVKEHAGFVDVSNSPGGGSTFRVYLPLGSGDARVRPALSTEIVPGSGSLLLVESNATSRTCFAAVLRKLGYRVFSAGDRETALQCLELGAKPDLILISLDMGATALRELLAGLRGAGVRAAGLADSPPPEVPADLAGVIIKPFSLAALSRDLARWIKMTG